MIISMIKEFGPHTNGELLHVRHVHLVMNVLQPKKGNRYVAISKIAFETRSSLTALVAPITRQASRYAIVMHLPRNCFVLSKVEPRTRRRLEFLLRLPSSWLSRTVCLVYR